MFARRDEMSEGGVSRPIAPMDTERLEKEMETYQNNLDAEYFEIISKELRSNSEDS